MYQDLYKTANKIVKKDAYMKFYNMARPPILMHLVSPLEPDYCR